MRALGEHGTRFEFECYDVSHLYNLAFFADRGLVKPPFFIQCIFGILGGIGPDPENLMHMRGIADRLFGKDYLLSVLGAGKHQMPFVTLSAILGGNVRVGLEDNLFLGRGKLAKSNAEQVVKIRRILEELGHEIATPAEARVHPRDQGRRERRLLTSARPDQQQDPQGGSLVPPADSIPHRYRRRARRHSHARLGPRRRPRAGRALHDPPALRGGPLHRARRHLYRPRAERGRRHDPAEQRGRANRLLPRQHRPDLRLGLELQRRL